MKVRHNKRRILINLRHNKMYIWLVEPYIQHAKKVKERNERIKKALDNM